MAQIKVIRHAPGPRASHVRLFVHVLPSGEGDTWALAGVLSFRADEEPAFTDALVMGGVEVLDFIAVPDGGGDRGELRVRE